MNSLEASIRNTKSKGEVNSLRQKGDVPAIIYGGTEENQKVSLSKKQIKYLIEQENQDNGQNIQQRVHTHRCWFLYFSPLLTLRSPRRSTKGLWIWQIVDSLGNAFVFYVTHSDFLLSYLRKSWA